MARRLVTVHDRVRAALDEAPPGPLRLLSLAAGQGRDVLPVLAEHPRRVDVRARLVELDPRNAREARGYIQHYGLTGVEVVEGDAAPVDQYRDLAPVDVLLLCGLFGNISNIDIEHTIRHARSLTNRGGTVLWTRHRGAPDMVPQICEWFAARDFEAQWVSEPEVIYAVGAHRAKGEPVPLPVDAILFTFLT